MTVTTLFELCSDEDDPLPRVLVLYTDAPTVVHQMLRNRTTTQTA